MIYLNCSCHTTWQRWIQKRTSKQESSYLLTGFRFGLDMTNGSFQPTAEQCENHGRASSFCHDKRIVSNWVRDIGDDLEFRVHWCKPGPEGEVRDHLCYHLGPSC